MSEPYDPDEDEARVFSVLSGTKRRNRWRVAAWTDILTVFGRTFLDLRQAETQADEINMSIWCVFGSVTILVPEGCDVRPSGMAFLAASDTLVPETKHPCEFPPLDVEANVVFGRVRVRTALGAEAPEPLPLDQPVVRSSPPGRIGGQGEALPAVPSGTEPVQSDAGEQPPAQTEPAPTVAGESAPAAPSEQPEAAPAETSAASEGRSATAAA